MNYDTAGSAEAVQKNLDAHTGNRSNPHGVTAAQVSYQQTQEVAMRSAASREELDAIVVDYESVPEVTA